MKKKNVIGFSAAAVVIGAALIISSLGEPDVLFNSDNITVFEDWHSQTRTLKLMWDPNTEEDMHAYYITLTVANLVDSAVIFVEDFSIEHPKSEICLDVLKTIPYDNDYRFLEICVRAVDVSGNYSIGTGVQAKLSLAYGDFDGSWGVDFKDLPKLIPLFGSSYINDSFSTNNLDCNADSVIDHKEITRFIANYGKDKLWIKTDDKLFSIAEDLTYSVRPSNRSVIYINQKN